MARQSRSNQGKTQGGKRPVRDHLASQRALRALDLINEGYTYREVALQVGYRSGGACFNAVDDELASVRFPKVDEYRKIHLFRLEELYKISRHEVDADMRAVEADDEDGEPQKRKGANLWAVDRCVSILERQAKLLGLDMPVLPDNIIQLPIIREYPEGLASAV